jgi:tetratricopeptide (TPR) repeat protein
MLLLVSSAITSARAQSFALSLRRMYVATAETQDASSVVDKIFDETSNRMQRSREYSYIPVQELQRQTAGIVLDDFDLRLEPNSLLHLKQPFILDVLFCFYIEKKNGDFVCRLSAKEFPSGIFINETEFPIDVKQKNHSDVLASIEEFIKQVKTRRADFGYSFHSDEKGVLIITDSYENQSFQNSLTGLWHAKKQINRTSDQRLAVKTVFYYFEGDSNYVDVAHALLKASNAQVVIIQSEHSSQQIIVVPADEVKLSALENDLPLWPPFDGFSFFSVDADSQWASNLGYSFFPQETNVMSKLLNYEAVNNDNAALLFSNTIRTLEDSLYADTQKWNDDVLAHMGELYTAFSRTFKTSKPELGWIALNHAQFLYYSKKYTESLNALESSFEIFDLFSNQFGPLFVYVLRGQINEEMLNSEKAAEAYEAAAKLAETLKDDRTLAWLYFRLGALSLELDRSLEAWSYFGFSAERYMGLGETATVVTLYTKIGVLLRNNKLLLKSRDYLQQALDLAKTMQDDRLTADADYHLAVTEEELGETTSALSRFEQAGDLMEILADSVYMASVEEHIGDILLTQKNWRNAQASFEYASRFYLYVDDIDGVIRCLIKSADASVERKKWHRAQNALDEALMLANRRSGQEWAAIILQKKGLAHIKAGDYTAGEKELELAKSTSLSKEDVDRYMKSLTRELEVELYNLQRDGRK